MTNAHRKCALFFFYEDRIPYNVLLIIEYAHNISTSANFHWDNSWTERPLAIMTDISLQIYIVWCKLLSKLICLLQVCLYAICYFNLIWQLIPFLFLYAYLSSCAWKSSVVAPPATCWVVVPACPWVCSYPRVFQEIFDSPALRLAAVYVAPDPRHRSHLLCRCRLVVLQLHGAGY